MYLKSLNLKGFKSFADSTTMVLEPGVTVVVGPNGSGKSNVVDAIAWVLGAQAPKSVRSQKMDDVIFAGTAKRPALGRAEVSITIDNADGTLGVDLTEITVTRILFRNGDSEYSINGVPCRLLDVQELLSDAGVGRQQHVIVSQGQIDAVLNARPEERRAIIEEAAGVLKFRKRKEKAERRLDATEANLLRVQDLLREVRRQLRPLERQAAAAERHGTLITELNAVKTFVAGREIASWRVKLESLAATRIESASTESELKSSLARLDTAVMAIEAELSARGQSDTGDRLVRVEQLRERARGLAAVLAERRRSLERDRVQLLDADLVASLEAEAGRFQEELIAVARDLDAMEPASAELVADEALFADERATALAAVGPSDQTNNRAASAAAEVRGELRSVRTAFDRVVDEVRRHEGRSASLLERIAVLEEAASRFRTECETSGEVESTLVEQVEAAEQQLAEALASAEARRSLRVDAAGGGLEHGRAGRGAPTRARLGSGPCRRGASRRRRRCARHAARPDRDRRRVGPRRRGCARRVAHGGGRRRSRRGTPRARGPANVVDERCRHRPRCTADVAAGAVGRQPGSTTRPFVQVGCRRAARRAPRPRRLCRRRRDGGRHRVGAPGRGRGDGVRRSIRSERMAHRCREHGSDRGRARRCGARRRRRGGGTRVGDGGVGAGRADPDRGPCRPRRR